jgi:hypothetical protein
MLRVGQHLLEDAMNITDRKVLIRLASSLPAGSDERKALLVGLKTAANVRWKPGRKPMETLWTAQYKGSELEVRFDEHEGEWRGFADGDHTLAVSTADEAKEDIIDAVDGRSKTAALDLLKAGLNKTAGDPASGEMAVKQVAGKLLNDRTIKKHLNFSKDLEGGKVKKIRLDDGRRMLVITLADQYPGISFFVTGNKGGKRSQTLVQSRGGIPAHGAISKVFKPIMKAVGEWVEEGKGDLLKAASSEDRWVKLFDELANKRRKTIQLDMSGVMGGGTNGMREFKRGRMGKPKQWRGSGSKGPFERVSLSILPLDDQGQPIKSRAGYKLWRSLYEDGSASISASVGDMGIMIKDMKP